MRYLNLFRASALLYITSVLAFGGVGAVLGEGMPITEPEHLLWYYISGTALTFSGFTCWFGAVRFWLHRRRARMARAMGAVVLVPYGFLFGWLYLLAARDPHER